MKVLHVIAPAPAGGAETVVRQLAAGQRAAGLEASIAALLPGSGAHPFVELARAEGLPVTEIRHGHRRYFAEADTLRRQLREGRFDVVHTHVYHADVVGWLAARDSGAAQVATLHGFTGGGLKHRFFTWLALRVLNRAGAVICVAETVRDQAVAQGSDPARLHLVRNGFRAGPMQSREQARAELGLAQDGAWIGWAGRLSHEKGADLLLDALPHAGDTARAVLLGDGPEREALVARAEPRARFIGPVTGVARLLPAFDALALSSRTEGTPMILLEAMAARVPVVAFAVGGVPQVLDETSAWLVRPGDTRAFGAALADVLARPDEAARRAGRAAERLARDFAVPAWVERVGAVYQSAMGRA